VLLAALSSQTLLTATRKETKFPPETHLPEAAKEDLVGTDVCGRRIIS